MPANLCVPDAGRSSSFEEGAFATVASVAMHGVRQADVRLGERVAVIGLGLVGQLAGQMLRAAGCGVVGVDLAETLVERALAAAVPSTRSVRRRSTSPRFRPSAGVAMRS